MKEDILNVESKITLILRKIWMYCIGKLSKLKTNVIGVVFFWELMNIAFDLDSFGLREFCLHQLDILQKHSRRSEQVLEKGSFGLIALI